MNTAATKTFGTTTLSVGDLVDETALRGRIGRVISVSDEGVRVAELRSFKEFSVSASLVRCGGLVAR